MTRDPTAGEADGTDGPGLSPSEQRRAVRERYGTLAGEAGEDGCCGGTDADAAAASSCGDGSPSGSRALGYADDEVDSVAPGADLGLGCGNPTALAALEPGQTVLDLGSGGGFDCLLAGQEVGPDGHVIGVDMTPEMIERARANVERNDADTVEFRLGEIEHPPVADGTVDVVISNCVVNLSPDKPQVLREAFRVLRPGGHLAISDVVLTAPLPDEIRADPTSVAACVAGAVPAPELEAMLADAGFRDVSVEPTDGDATFVRDWDPERDLRDYVVPATIEAEKPATGGADA